MEHDHPAGYRELNADQVNDSYHKGPMTSDRDGEEFEGLSDVNGLEDQSNMFALGEDEPSDLLNSHGDRYF
jgi:hypothetical protein